MRIRFTNEAEHAEYQERLRQRRIQMSQYRKELETVFTFCPNYILMHNMEPVHLAPFVGVLLDIQITGMHRIIEKYNMLHEGGIYKLTYTLNGYLSAIIETVYYWGGDVLKIYGDRCVMIWEVLPDASLYEVLHVVILCAFVIKTALSGFNTNINQKLDMKMAIACGNIHPTCHGNENKLLVFRGEPLEDIFKLSLVVKPGDILISEKSWEILITDRYNATPINTSTVKLLDGKVAYKANERGMNEAFNVKEIEVFALIAKHIEFMRTLHTARLIDSIETFGKLRSKFMENIPPRKAILEAIRFGNYDTIRSFVSRRVQAIISEHQPVEYLTEHTTASLQMISIMPNSIECMSDAFIKIIHGEISKIIEGTNAFIYMFEVTTEIKIIVIRGVQEMRQDIESKRALRTAYQLIRRFEDLPGINWVSVGIFLSYLFCGVVGHPLRSDYVALGNIFNKGFKILKRNSGKVICDYKTFKFSKLSSYLFRCLRKQKCNISFDTGQLMEYNEDLDNGTTKSDQFKEDVIFGRDMELRLITKVLQSNSPITQGIVFDGRTSIGKTSLLQLVSNRASNSSAFIMVSLSLLKGSNAPLSTISRIYDQLYTFHSNEYEGLDSCFELPTLLHDRHSYAFDEDKYSECGVINNLLRILDFGGDRTTIIIIRNMHLIDDDSWRILKSIMMECKLRLFAGGDFAGDTALLKDIQQLPFLTYLLLPPLSDYWVNTQACNLLGVGAIQNSISKLITSACSGNPGHVLSCVINLINSENYDVTYINKDELPSDFNPIHNDIYNALPKVIGIMSTKTEKVAGDGMLEKWTVASITRAFYFSLDAFNQSVLKISSVLGVLFSRELLILALHTKDGETLRKSIKMMFKKNVFECGSAYVAGSNISFNKYCCRCYINEAEAPGCPPSDRYMHCKLIHFKDENLRKTAYNLLPANQKRDLHLFFTDVLEKTVHYCPKCLRDPINSFVVAPTYYETLKYCSGSGMELVPQSNSSECMKDCIRQLIHNPTQEKKSDNCDIIFPLRSYFAATDCNCIEMLLFLFQKLMYHSKKAKHLGKQIFYYSIYGFLLILTEDYSNGIAILREAHEFCMVDVGSARSEIPEGFRKFNIGRISLMAASALLKIGKLKQAKAHVSLAIRQYNIPSVAFKYHHFQWLLKKSFLVHSFGHHRPALKRSWARWEIGICFILCARIFAQEGNLPNARNCAKYSAWILGQLNERVPMLFEAYCDVIDYYRYGLDKSVCERLQQYVTKEVIKRYCNNKAYYAKHLMTLLIVDFELTVTNAKLKHAICKCYRIVDTTLKFYVYATNYDFTIWYSLLFTYTMRFHQFIDLMKVIYKNIPSASQMWYYSNALDITLKTGYSYLPIDTLLRDILAIVNTESGHYNKSWAHNYMLSLLLLHMLKTGAHLAAEKFRPNCNVNSGNVRRPIVMRVLLNLLEADLWDAFYKMQANVSHTRIIKVINRKIKIALEAAKYMPVFYPRVHCLKAWKLKLTGYPKKARKELKKAEQYSNKHGNIYFRCLINKTESYWDGAKQITSYKSRHNVQLDAMKFFNEKQWSQVLIPYPVLSLSH